MNKRSSCQFVFLQDEDDGAYLSELEYASNKVCLFYLNRAIYIQAGEIFKENYTKKTGYPGRLSLRTRMWRSSCGQGRHGWGRVVIELIFHIH